MFWEPSQIDIIKGLRENVESGDKVIASQAESYDHLCERALEEALKWTKQIEAKDKLIAELRKMLYSVLEDTAFHYEYNNDEAEALLTKESHYRG